LVRLSNFGPFAPYLQIGINRESFGAILFHKELI
jgi:hypothetical protein